LADECFAFSSNVNGGAFCFLSWCLDCLGWWWLGRLWRGGAYAFDWQLCEPYHACGEGSSAGCNCGGSG
jgi:hypothetical protein